MTNEPIPPTRRRWFQFRLRTLLVVMLVISLGMGWVMKERRRIAERREAFVSAGLMFSVGEDSYQPVWHLILFGVDVRFASRIWGDSTTTDDGLVHLRELTRLHSLYLRGDQVTDAGMVHLKGLKQLQVLNLNGTQVTDSGLEQLRELTQLKILWLTDTQVTYAGVAKLQTALPNCKIYP